MQTPIKRILSNGSHRYGKQYCTPHRIHESQLDELVFGEVRNLKEKIVAESEKYDEIIKQWLKQKPAYDLQIRQYEEKIFALKQQIEDLIMGKVTDKTHTEFYDSMIEKREREIAELQKKISDCREYDKVCKQWQQTLTSTSSLLDDILSEGRISDANLRMLVSGVTIHQNEDKSLDVQFEMNGDFSSSTTIMLELVFKEAL